VARRIKLMKNLNDPCGNQTCNLACSAVPQPCHCVLLRRWDVRHAINIFSAIKTILLYDKASHGLGTKTKPYIRSGEWPYFGCFKKEPVLPYIGG
jgi:hypothetical protein